ncbi:MAG TPA: transporter, partial [Myxococcota bacterium]|nr:transporter [Myxococcota bacterium]
EDFPTLGDACDGADADFCANGVLACTADGSGVECAEPGAGFADVCNGFDDDCDGATDEDFPTLGDACDGADADFCTTGTWACTAGGGIACDEAGEGNVETCNGRDDDCDGDTDEGFPDVNRNGVADCMEPEGRGFRGGGGCVAGAGPGAGTGVLLLPFAIAALAFARRRRFAATVAFLAGLALAGASRPAVAQQVDPDLFLPAPSTWDGIALRTTRPMEHLSHRYGLNLAWAKDLLVGEDDAGRPMRAIAHRATAVVTAAIGLWNRLDIGLALPVHLRQTADGYPAPGASSAATGLGDLVLAPKVALWVPRDGWGPGVAIAVDLTFPTGRSRLMG